jgi:ABC-type multidrug transport system fused ATPase/permease subunit
MPPAITGSPSSHAVRVDPNDYTNFELLKHMFQFVRPVRFLAVLACLLVALGVFLEISSVDLTRVVINTVSVGLSSASAGKSARPELAPLHHAVHAAEPSNAPHDIDTFPGARQPAATKLHWHEFQQGSLRVVLILIGMLALFIVLSSVCNFFRSVVNTKLSMDMVFHMRSAVYDQLQQVGFSFHDAHSSGQLINRALSDLHNVRFFVNLSLVSIAEIVGYTIGYNILIATINPWVGLASLLPVPFWIWYILRFGKKMRPVQRDLMATGDKLVNVYSENVSGVNVVKAFATETTETGKYNSTADTYFSQVMTTVAMWANFIPVIRGIATGANLLLFFLGSLLAVSGKLHAGDILVFGVAMGAILSRLQQINQIANQYQMAVVSARRFFEILYAYPSIAENPALRPLPPGPGAVQFADVTFGYQPAKPVLNNISFNAPAGAVVALVGPTGSGKTTMMQLLARFYDPQQGAIYVDGYDIRTVALRSLRQAMGFVFQETFLFSDTVLNNIRYGDPNASAEQVEAAARIAQAHEFIMEMPRQYDTLLGERGLTLSGGQKQRLAIARAIVADPRILILDDAMAAVDPETEHLIRRALELVLRDRTVFIIAHRLSTVKAADLVLVLEQGRITQAGTHDELLRQAGHYREIAEVQLLGGTSGVLPPLGSTARRAAEGERS